MHKTADGKVIASLTEVKNKTGDIFALADEYGEVMLTSYNKPRYKIVKMSIDDMFDLDRKEAPKAEKKSVLNKVKSTVSKVTARPTPVIVPAPSVEAEVKAIEEVKGMVSNDLIAKLSKMKAFDRESKDERIFVKRALIPLQ